MSILLTSAESFTIPNTFMIWLWVGLAILFGIAEAITLGITSIWFAIGAAVAALIAIFHGPIWLQCGAFVLISIVTILLTRPLALKHLNNRLEKTNSESLIGKVTPVIETIDNSKGTGKVRFGDVEWMARTEEDSQVVEAGQKVTVLRIEGVKCIVKPNQQD